MKRTIIVLVFLFVVCLIWAGGAKEQAAQKEVTLTLWGWDIQPASVVELGDEFIKLYPHVKFNPVTMSYSDTRDKLIASLMSGVGAPDLCFGDVQEIGGYISVGGLLDLTEEAMPVRNEYVPAWFDANLGEKGKVWGFPWDGGVASIWYRKDKFDEAGVKFPKSWQEFIEVGKKLTIDKDGDGKPDQYMISLPAYGRTAYYAMFIQSRGGQMTNRKGEILFDNPIVVSTLQWAHDLIYKHKIAYPTDSQRSPAYYQMFKEDMILTEVQGSWWAGTGLKRLCHSEGIEGKWRVHTWLPWKPGDAPTGGTWGGSATVIPAQTKNPKEAIALAKFIGGRVESQMHILKKFDKWPVYKPAYAEMIDMTDPFFGDQQVYKLYIEQLKNTPSWIYGPKWTPISTAVDKAWERAISGQATVANAIKEAVIEAEKLTK